MSKGRKQKATEKASAEKSEERLAASEPDTDYHELTGKESLEELEQKAGQAEKAENPALSDTEKESSYSIYNYLKKTPSVLIALVSGCVAFVSFAINYISFLQDYKLAKYWDINTSIIKVSGDKALYTILFSFFLIVVSLMINGLLRHSFDAFTPYYNWHKYCRQRLKHTKKGLKQNKQRIQKIKKLKSQTKTIIGETPDSAATQDESEQAGSTLEDIDAEIDDTISENTNLKRDVKKAHRFNRVRFGINILIAFIAQYAVAYIYLITTQYQPVGQAWLFAAVLTVLWLILPCLLNYITMRRKYSKSKKTSEKHNKPTPIWNEDDDHEFPIEKVVLHGVKKMMTNSWFAQTAFCVVYSLVMLMLTIGIRNSSYEDQKRFETVWIDNTQYVSVYSNSEIIVLEEVDINNGEAKIYLAKQRIVLPTDYPYEVITFDSVKQITNNAGK